MKEAEIFADSKVFDILQGLDTLYGGIMAAQQNWKEKTPAPCPEGCGLCCVSFEPDVLECEALYLATWMLTHQKERAEKLAAETKNIKQITKTSPGCFLFDAENPHHCTVYGGRCLICRLFAYSGDHGKNGELRWRPCKFLPKSAFSRFEHRQYSGAEMQKLFGAVPPDMAQLSAGLFSLNPESSPPRPLREALPDAIKKLKMLLRFLDPPEPNSPSPSLFSPRPISA